nr:protein PYRICULARIA ORYZAE RESISTANCE 21-like isoform X2 [Malus domestica]
MGQKEKVTTMVLKVDLQCHKCYKKVKKVLCKFPQIRDQKYNEKQNQVVIKVVCCNPEKIRDKICCKGGSAIKSIKIKEPEKPKDDNKPETKGDSKPETKGDNKHECGGKPKCDCKPKCDDKPKCDNKPKCDGKKDPVVPECPPPVRTCCMDCCQGHAGGPCCSGYGGNKKDDCKPNDPVVPKCPPPVTVCCMDCCQGHVGGPCCSGYGGKKKDDCKPKDLAVLGYPMPVRTCCMDCYQGHADGPCYSGCGGGHATVVVAGGHATMVVASGPATVVMAGGQPRTSNMMVTIGGLCITVTAVTTWGIVLLTLTISVKKIPQLAQSCKSSIILLDRDTFFNLGIIF